MYIIIMSIVYMSETDFVLFWLLIPVIFFPKIWLGATGTPIALAKAFEIFINLNGARTSGGKNNN